MSSPTLSAPYRARVLVEVVIDGVPRRVNVWEQAGSVYVAFAVEQMPESLATAIVKEGRDLLAQVDVPALFREPTTGRRRRFIETGEV